jgi:hypothetical protein
MAKNSKVTSIDIIDNEVWVERNSGKAKKYKVSNKFRDTIVEAVLRYPLKENSYCQFTGVGLLFRTGEE